MGAARHGRRHSDGGRPLNTAARVVPNVPTFSVDDGFWYSIPGSLTTETQLGSIVRIPLGGRRVRGWVVEIGPAPVDKKLREIAGVSSQLPVFDRGLLDGLDWAAHHYVAPMSVVLNKASPPNLPKPTPDSLSPVQSVESVHPLRDVTLSVVSGQRVPARAVLGSWQGFEWLSALSVVLAWGGTVAVVAATLAEARIIGLAARESLGNRVVAVESDVDAEVTASWSRARSSGVLVVGTPRIATWYLPGLSLVVVIEEGRRAMKDRQTPTIHVRELMRTRSLVEGFALVFMGPTPSVEIVASGAEIVRVGNRAWPLVEVVDRSVEPPGSGLVSDRVVAALRAVTRLGGDAFVFTSHRMADDLVHEINSRLGRPSAGVAPTSRPVAVGTERDLAELGGVVLTVACNVDGMLHNPGYRTTEEALRQLARLATALAPGSGRRMMIQTFDPSSTLVETLRRGDPLPYLENVLVDRAKAGLPPATEAIAVEVRGTVPSQIGEDLRKLKDAEVLGPLSIEDGMRWLLQGDLRSARLALRRLVAGWRGEQTHVRIDADPIDL